MVLLSLLNFVKGRRGTVELAGFVEGRLGTFELADLLKRSAWYR